jgi:predicted  nucleic acid-binding Zn-ribbon protein
VRCVLTLLAAGAALQAVKSLHAAEEQSKKDRAAQEEVRQSISEQLDAKKEELKAVGARLDAQRKVCCVLCAVCCVLCTVYCRCRLSSVLRPRCTLLATVRPSVRLLACDSVWCLFQILDAFGASTDTGVGDLMQRSRELKKQISEKRNSIKAAKTEFYDQKRAFFDYMQEQRRIRDEEYKKRREAEAAMEAAAAE